ncbi:hypothetical protein EDB92DRAFT_1821037 [Lactarius akahatsu]|uniref:Uncharacterized protein n=1 Tax=Lactarius akahatsu TaxID=416441 RepID=A0AAD4L436_9AGAM|nr:hypothetical protein EDB92DRAFT_1821037 [Lactarius akahatsu]
MISLGLSEPGGSGRGSLETDDWYISWFGYLPDQSSIPRAISMLYGKRRRRRTVKGIASTAPEMSALTEPPRFRSYQQEAVYTFVTLATSTMASVVQRCPCDYHFYGLTAKSAIAGCHPVTGPGTPDFQSLRPRPRGLLDNLAPTPANQTSRRQGDICKGICSKL